MKEYIDLFPFSFHLLFALSVILSSVSMHPLKNVNRKDAFGPEIYSNNTVYGVLMITYIWNVLYSVLFMFIVSILIGVSRGFFNGFLFFCEYGLYSWAIAGVLEKIYFRQIGYSQFWKPFSLPIDFYIVYLLSVFVFEGFNS